MLYQLQQEKAKLVLDEFKAWFDKLVIKVTQKRIFDQAIAYSLNQWQRLTGYPIEECLVIDNNGAQNTRSLGEVTQQLAIQKNS